jgi:hypothetical protein
MARRRYVSTTISQDTRVNKLAVKYGDFAALLYTWMIPHAADDATLPGDPEELLYQVLPGRRDKTEADVQQALDGMAALGLIEWDRINNVIHTDLARWLDRRGDSAEQRAWRRTVLTKDDHTCQVCGAYDVPLQAHHIRHWAAYPDERLDPANGITLCTECHRAEHRKGGN